MSNETLITNSIQQLFKNDINNYIFIYTPPKVGSTTLVTSLRVSLGKKYNIIHIHDEIMLSVLTGINGVKINDIIHFLSKNNKKVYVIDVYRPSIERKMSEYFEKMASYHFNNTYENISNYSMKRLSDRFNKIFLHIENDDHYFDKYNIKAPTLFDFNKKYTTQIINNITYIKLRLCDSNIWNTILSTIFQEDIVIIKDYATEDKPIGKLYKTFKDDYKIPDNFFQTIKNDKYLQFYYNEVERNAYLKSWSNKICANFVPYTETEFKFYMNLCLENQYINDIQCDHYIDNGCFCKNCNTNRRQIFIRAKAGETHFEKMIHTRVYSQPKKSKSKFIHNQFSINIYK